MKVTISYQTGDHLIVDLHLWKPSLLATFIGGLCLEILRITEREENKNGKF